MTNPKPTRLERLRTLYSMIAPDDYYDQGQVVLTAYELGDLLNVVDAAENWLYYVDESGLVDEESTENTAMELLRRALSKLEDSND